MTETCSYLIENLDLLCMNTLCAVLVEEKACNTSFGENKFFWFDRDCFRFFFEHRFMVTSL